MLVQYREMSPGPEKGCKYKVSVPKTYDVAKFPTEKFHRLKVVFQL